MEKIEERPDYSVLKHTVSYGCQFPDRAINRRVLGVAKLLRIRADIITLTYLKLDT